MSLYKQGDRWWSRIMFEGKTYTNPLLTKNVKEARQREAEIRTKITNRKFNIQNETITVTELRERFINYLPDRVAPETYRTYNNRWKAIGDFKPLMDAKLDEIDHVLLDKFIAHRQAKGDAIATINLTLRALRVALGLAKRWKLIDERPEVKLLRGENKREYVISEDDEVEIKHRIENPTIQHIFTFLIDTGLRVGEACKLTWDDVDAAGVHVREGKTKNAIRTVPLTARAARVIDIMREQRNDHAYIFLRDNRPFDANAISYAFRNAARAAGISGEAVLHSTRHTFCTRLGKKGVSPYVLQKLAGHGSIEISSRYCHPDAEQLSDAIGTLNGNARAGDR